MQSKDNFNAAFAMIQKLQNISFYPIHIFFNDLSIYPDAPSTDTDPFFCDSSLYQTLSNDSGAIIWVIGFSRTNHVIPPATTATAAAQHTTVVTIFLLRCFFFSSFAVFRRCSLRCCARNSCFSDGFFLFAIIFLVFCCTTVMQAMCLYS